MTITTYVSMDLALAGARGRVNAMQNDKYTRQVILCLYEQGVPWVIPEGVTAVVRYRKADGTGGIYDALPDGSTACSIADNKVTLVLAPQVCTAAGPVQLSVSLQQNETELLTFPVQVQVYADPGEGVKSEDYIEWWGKNHGYYSLFADPDGYVPDWDPAASAFRSFDVSAYVDPKELSQATAAGLTVRLWWKNSALGLSAKADLTHVEMVESEDEIAVWYLGYVQDAYTTPGQLAVCLSDITNKESGERTVKVHFDNSMPARFLAALKGQVVQTVNGVGPDANGNVAVDISERSELITSTPADLDSGRYKAPIIDLEFYTYEKDTATIANRGVLGADGNATVTLNGGSAYYDNLGDYGVSGLILTNNANFTVPTNLIENNINSVYTWVIGVSGYKIRNANYCRICRSNKDVPSVYYYAAGQKFCAKLAATGNETNVLSYNSDIFSYVTSKGWLFDVSASDTLAFTCDGSTIRLYVNGVEAMAMLRSYMTVSDVTDIGCGDTSNTSDYYFSALKINKFLLYNRCLSEEELQEVM